MTGNPTVAQRHRWALANRGQQRRAQNRPSYLLRNVVWMPGRITRAPGSRYHRLKPPEPRHRAVLDAPGDTRETPRHAEPASFRLAAAPAAVGDGASSPGVALPRRTKIAARHRDPRFRRTTPPPRRCSVGDARLTAARPHTLGLRGLKQGGGLDFVRQRGYGRLRWLEYPAETTR